MRRIRTTFWPEIPLKGDVRREILVSVDEQAVGNGGIRVAQIWAGLSKNTKPDSTIDIGAVPGSRPSD